MSAKTNKQRRSNINLFFNKQINLFPEDFFSTYDKTNECELDKKNNEHPKLINPSYVKKKEKNNQNNSNSRNTNTNIDDKSKNNLTNIIKLDIICNTDFSFQAPSSPNKNICKNQKKNFLSVINKNNSLKPLFKSSLNEKVEKQDINKNNKNIQKRNNINNSDNKIKKMKHYNIKYNQFFKETNLKFYKQNLIKNKKINKNITTNNEKEKILKKDSNQNLYYFNNFIYNDISNEKENEKKLNITSEKNNKININFYRPLTPVIKNKKIKKILNINKSKEIVLKSSSSNYINNKDPTPNTEKKVINNSKVVSDINIFKKRTAPINNYKKNNSTNKNKYNSIVNKKNNIQEKLKNTINNIFNELPKNCEDNPIIFNKFNSLIKNMKNIQQIIQKKKHSFSNNKIFEKNSKNIEKEKYNKDFS